MTTHSVVAVGRPLLAKGAKQLAPVNTSTPDCELPALTTSRCAPIRTTPPSAWPIRMARPRWKPMPRRGIAAVGPQTADPSRICSRVGPEALGRVRQLLSGY